MIKHFPEGFVSFEDSRCQRYPYLPKINEKITVDCIVTENAEAPVLCLEANGENAEISGISMGNNSFRFDLGAYSDSVDLTYYIKSGQETTRKYVCHVCREENYTSFAEIYKDGDTHYGVLDKGLCVVFDYGKHIKVCCKQMLPKGRPVEKLDENSLDLDNSRLWNILENGKTILKAKYVRVLFDANGIVRQSVLGLKTEYNNIFGTGERFDTVNQKGRFTSGLVEERCFYQEEVTYIPIPFFFTEKGVGFYSNSTIPASMRFDDIIEITREAEDGEVFNDCYFTGKPAEIMKEYYSVCGKPVLPPDWVFGVWISANGWNRTEEIYEAIDEMRSLDYPASVLVLEPWSDEKTYRIWSEDRFHNHEKMMKDVKEAGLHVVLWQISTIHKTYPHRICADYGEALENGYYVKNADGTPYYIPDGWCKGDLVMDFSNPDACKWWFGERKHLLDEGVEGFKTDGGEYLFDHTLKLFDGTTGLAARNKHPLQYQKAYNDFMRENGVNGITFSRSGYAGSQCSPLHWAGDQSSEWRELRGQYTAGITAGLSGLIFWGFDIGSLAGELPDKQLYLRSTALACFCPVMQWHSTVMPDQLAPRSNKDEYNDRSPWNLARQFKDDEIACISAKFARLRHQMIPYISEEAKYCVENSRPLMAHLCFDYPNDKKAWDTNDEYMFGRSLLVAPILTENTFERDVYLPEGKWTDFFDGMEYEGNNTYTLGCPLDKALVFKKV